MTDRDDNADKLETQKQNQRELQAMFAGIILGAVAGGVAAYMLWSGAGGGGATEGSGSSSPSALASVTCLTPLLIGGGAILGAFLASCLPARSRGSACWACGAAVGTLVALAVAGVASLVADAALSNLVLLAIVFAGAAIGALACEARRFPRQPT